MEVTLEGLPEVINTLNNVDNGIRFGMRRALFRIGALVKRTAVDYAPISPSTSMLKAFAKKLKSGGEFANTLYVAGRKGRSGQAVKLTAFYEHRLPMLLSKDPRSTSRPTPGGLENSIMMTSDDNHAEIYVPANSPAGEYAYKIHEERGSKWKDLGPGSQAKGPQAREKFITRAISDNETNIITIMTDQIDKAIGGTK